MAKTINGKRYSWNQAVCPPCYGAEYPNNTPVTLNDRKVETCCQCGIGTGAGTYYRVDPATVPYPTPEDD